MKTSSALLVLLLTLPLAACGDRDEADTAGTVTASPAPMDEGALATQRNTVAVVLTEYAIDVPASVPAGPTTFSITNDGTEEHSFEIEGQGIERELAANLQPGGSATLDVDLQPGTYRIYRPVEGHPERGIERRLQVTAVNASTAGALAY